jgi:hypothetical protein
MKIEIIKGIKAPLSERGRKPKYPFHKMVKGDTIPVDVSAITIRSSAYAFNRRHKIGWGWKVWTVEGKTFLQRTR